MSKTYIELTEKQEKNYNHLCGQIERIYSNKPSIKDKNTNKPGKKKKKYNTKISTSDKTEKSRLRTAARVLAQNGVQNIKNLDQKRLNKVIATMKEVGYSTSSIKNTLSSIQNFNNANFQNKLLPSDVILEKHGIENRRQATGERAWTDLEYKKMIDRAYEVGRMDVVMGLKMGRNLGFRGREICKVTVKDLKDALINGSKIHTVGKGGKPRDAQFGMAGKKTIQELLEIAQKDCLKDGDIIFTQSPTLLQNTGAEVGKTSVNKRKQSIENFIINNREEIQESDRITQTEAEKASKNGDIHRVELTLHGLRHNYAQNSLEWILKKNPNMPLKTAKGLVSVWLGHGKKRSINTYLKKANVQVQKSEEM
ncbi:integrase domain-containing protein [Clostridium perfringens]|uniref:integrase domain-containing protein n=1 Tax=Clostridium perfringens TaxID=1502 RepID=UPI0024BCA6F7|nr:integrase domain-containing protein [Clostridium perfringens]